MSRKNHNAEMNAQIFRLNNVGLALSTIAELLSCHPSTVTNRLRAMNVPINDSRRAFMEELLQLLDVDTQNWLVDELVDREMNSKEFLALLIKKEHLNVKEQRSEPDS